LRRHKIGAAFAALAGLAILGGVGATARESRIAADNAQRAERRFNDVRALANSNLFELNDALEKLPASAPARHLLIQRSLEYLDKLRTENGSDRDLMRQTALGYERIAELQGRFTGTGVGDVNNSLASYRKALAIRSRLVEISNQAPDEVQNETRLLGEYTRTLLLSGYLEEALQRARTGVSLARQLANNQPQDAQAHLAYANAALTLSWTLGGNGSSPTTRQFDDAIAEDREVIEELSHLNSGDSKTRQRLSMARLMMAMHYWKAREFKRSLDILDGVLSRETLPSVGPVLILRAHNWRGHVFVGLGDHRRALRDYREGLLLARSVLSEHPDDMDARLDRDILNGLSSLEEARQGDARTGLKSLNEALSSIEQMFAVNPELFYQRILIVGYSFRGEILSMLGDQTGARANLSRSASIAEGLAKKDRLDLDPLLQMARAHAALGVLWARSARFGEARIELATSATLAKQLLAIRPADVAAKDLAGTVESQLAALALCSDNELCRAAKQFQLPSLIE
jgi:tetratricopeptide (TPR) repeat protein